GPVNATARIDGRRVALDAKAAAYGANATTAGRITLPDFSKPAKTRPIEIDLHGRARNIDLRRLPRDLEAPTAKTNVNADYRVAGAVGQGVTTALRGDARFEPSRVADATIASGSKVAFTMSGTDVAYMADATVSGLNLRRIGEEFAVPALAVDRYDSSINAHVVAQGSGTTPKTMEVTANGTIDDTTILGGNVARLTFDASMSHDTAHLKAAGSFSGFDPATISDKPDMKEIKGAVGGDLDVDATVAGVSTGVTVDSVRTTAKVNIGASSVGGLDITHATLDADYHNSTGNVRTLDVAGRDLNVNGSGTIALNDTGQSNLKVHADS